MFTGLISDVGVVERIAPRQGGARLTLRPRALDVSALALGESVACSGCCLTVAERGGGLVAFDAVGEVLARVAEGQGARLTVSLPPAIAPLVAEKGSIAVDGVSLTVARAQRDRFEVALIPETLARTTLGVAAAGTRVNLEADVVARHVARLVELGAAPGGLDASALGRWGYGGRSE
jgi:riboflavin synthase